MIYYTQFIFIKKGKEEPFNFFENKVLPLLEKYNGKLLYRIRPAASDVIETNLGYPYEMHLVSFETRDDFKAYAQDEVRQRYLPLRNESIADVMLIEGDQI